MGFSYNMVHPKPAPRPWPLLEYLRQGHPPCRVPRGPLLHQQPVPCRKAPGRREDCGWASWQSTFLRWLTQTCHSAHHTHACLLRVCWQDPESTLLTHYRDSWHTSHFPELMIQTVCRCRQTSLLRPTVLMRYLEKIIFSSKMTEHVQVLWKFIFLLDKIQETIFHLMTALNPGQIGKSVSPDWANNFEQIIYSVKIAAFPH